MKTPIGHCALSAGVEGDCGRRTRPPSLAGEIPSVDLAERTRTVSSYGALARPGDVLVSRTVVDLVGGSGFQFSERGKRALAAGEEAQPLFAVR